MKKKKLVLKKDTIVALEKSEQHLIVGGTYYTRTCNTDGCVTATCPLTQGGCDIPTIGHDDGPNCVSATDWGWCWCYGQG